MKITRMALSAMIAGACFGGMSSGLQAQTQNPYKSVSYSDASAPSANCDATGCTSSGDSGCNGGCNGGAGSCDGLGCGAGLGLLGNCCLGEPWKLFSGDVNGWKVGGWSNVGYHTANTNFNFNNYDNRVQLQQQWFWAEKVADGSCGLGLGGRIDYLYGTDAPDTQAFGITNNHWDNGWDQSSTQPQPVGGAFNGYGHAIPQAYVETAYENLSVKFGKFFTIIGNEVVAATGNFFYSRQFTFYNAEPFTHTGFLSTYNLDDDTQLYNGWVSGWDSGFERNGSGYLGGFKRTLSDSSSILFATNLGRIGKELGEDGTLNSVIYTKGLSDNLTYISQTDVLYTTNGGGGPQRNTWGNINYLIYKVNDCVSLGQRFEWFNFGGAGFNNVRNDDLYNYTVGINYRASANLMLRPEMRYVWDHNSSGAPFGFLENGKSSQAIFGTDMIFTF
ncbi:MAG: outer membrane beta-barrel protein [Pirellulaceae bacterium]|nr:outer membrane beta-barrel protein [Pirellulaceae bacterium]